MKLEKDTTISHYKIISEIGKGGMGEVYLAEDTTLERKVAVKMLTHECCEDSEKLQRFAQEAKTASALNHPNIITIFEFGEHDDTHFMATEYIDGRELSQILSDEEKLSVRDSLEIAVQIVAALKTAHEAGIVHRDIKPGNIMVRNDGIVKILDFGLVKLTNVPRRDEIEDEAITRTKLDTIPGLVMGTPNYMSPEQARGKDIDHQTDIFSLGIVLYEMLAGVRPFQGETTSDVIAAVLAKEPEPLSSFNPKVPDDLDVIVSSCLRKDKGERYRDAADLLGDLQAFQEKLNVQDHLKEALGSDPSIQITLDDSGVHTVTQTEPVSSIAVLPFRDMSADEGDDYFSEGLTEEIIMNLSKLPTLSVIARGSAFAYSIENKSHKQIADDLGARYLLEGSVRRHRDDLRITTQLVDSSDQTYIWSETYRGTLDDVFEIQEKVATEIASALQVKLSPDEKRNLGKRYTENTEAYQLYLQGDTSGTKEAKPVSGMQ